MKIVFKILLIIVSFYLFTVLGIGGLMKMQDIYKSDDYKDVSGIVIKHEMIPQSHHKSTRVYYDPYLIVKTDNYGLRDFKVSVATYGGYSDGDRITFKHIDVSRYNECDRFVDVAISLGIVLLFIIYVCSFFMGFYFLLIYIWYK